MFPTFQSLFQRGKPRTIRSARRTQPADANWRRSRAPRIEELESRLAPSGTGIVGLNFVLQHAFPDQVQVLNGPVPLTSINLDTLFSDSVTNDWSNIVAGTQTLPFDVPNLNAPTLTSGGSLKVGQQLFFVVTAVLPFGESAPSNEVSLTPTRGQQTASLSWSSVPTATAYHVWVSTTSQKYKDVAATVTGGTSFSDPGGLVLVSSLPSGLTIQQVLEDKVEEVEQGMGLNGYGFQGPFITNTGTYAASVITNGGKPQSLSIDFKVAGNSVAWNSTLPKGFPGGIDPTILVQTDLDINVDIPLSSNRSSFENTPWVGTATFQNINVSIDGGIASAIKALPGGGDLINDLEGTVQYRLGMQQLQFNLPNQFNMLDGLINDAGLTYLHWATASGPHASSPDLLEVTYQNRQLVVDGSPIGDDIVIDSNSDGTVDISTNGLNGAGKPNMATGFFPTLAPGDGPVTLPADFTFDANFLQSVTVTCAGSVNSVMVQRDNAATSAEGGLNRVTTSVKGHGTTTLTVNDPIGTNTGGATITDQAVTFLDQAATYTVQYSGITSLFVDGATGLPVQVDSTSPHMTTFISTDDQVFVGKEIDLGQFRGHTLSGIRGKFDVTGAAAPTGVLVPEPGLVIDGWAGKSQNFQVTAEAVKMPGVAEIDYGAVAGLGVVEGTSAKGGEGGKNKITISGITAANPVSLYNADKDTLTGPPANVTTAGLSLWDGPYLGPVPPNIWTIPILILHSLPDPAPLVEFDTALIEPRIAQQLVFNASWAFTNTVAANSVLASAALASRPLRPATAIDWPPLPGPFPNTKLDLGLTIKGDQERNKNDALIVDDASDGLHIRLNGESFVFAAGIIHHISINLGTGHNTVDVEAMAAGDTLTIGTNTNGSDVVSLGLSGQSLDNLKGRVTIVGNGKTSVALYDQSGSSGSTYVLESGAIVRNGVALVADTKMAAITLHTSTGAMVNVAPFEPLQYSRNALPTLAVDGAQDTAVTVTDETTSAVLTAYMVTSAGVQIRNGNAPAWIINVAGGGALTLDTTATANTVDVESTAGMTTINEAAAASTVAVCPLTQNLDGIGLLTINGSDTTTLAVNDHAGTAVASGATTYALTGAGLTRSVSSRARNLVSTIVYAGVQSLDLESGPLGATYAIRSTTAGTPVTIDAQAAGNQFDLGNGSVKEIQSLVTLNSAGANSSVMVDDSQASTQDQVTVGGGVLGDVGVGLPASDQFFGSGGGLHFTGPASLALNLSQAAGDTLAFSPSPVTAFTFNGSAAEFQAGQGATLGPYLTAATNPLLTSTSPGAGHWTFGNDQQVSFTNMRLPSSQATPTIQVSDAGGTYNGQPFPASATVLDSQGNTIDSSPDSSLTFTYYVGSDTSGTNLGANAPATAGTYTVVAHYAGNTSYLPADSSPVTFTIGMAHPDIIWPTPDPITYGTPLSTTQLDWSIAGGLAGSFSNGPTAGTILDAGTHTLEVYFVPYDRTDYYVGDAKVELEVNQAQPTVNLSSTANPTTAGQSVTITAIVLPPIGGTPTGNVTFYDGSTAIGTATLANFGGEQMASITTSTLPIGDNYIIANYVGNQDFSSQTSGKMDQVVQGLVSWATPSAITYGTALDGAQLDATASVPGTFSYNPPQGSVLGAGAQTLTVTFTPTDSADYSQETATVQLQVNQAQPAVNLSSSANPSMQGYVTLSAVFLPPIGGVPVAKMTFYNGSTVIGSAPLAEFNGLLIASLTVNTLPIGENYITAAYPGDNNFLTATSGNLVQQVLPFAHALSFDGSQSYVEVPYAESQYTQATSAATLAGWIYLNQLPSANHQSMFIMGKSDSNDPLELLVGTDNKIHFIAGFNSLNNSVASSTVLQAHEWYFVAATYSATQLQIYINGSLDATLNGTLARGSSASPFTIGTSLVPSERGSALQYLFAGLIAAPSYWGVALTVQQIQDEMASGVSGSPSGLYAYWSMSEGSGDTIASSNGDTRQTGLLGDGVAADAPAWVTQS
jgi:hypothetical protein